jgi:hypothetical protein
MDHEIGFVARCVGHREVHTQPLGYFATRNLRIHHLHRAARSGPPASRQANPLCRTDHRDAITDPRRCVPQRIDGLQICREHGTGPAHRRQNMNGIDRHHVPGLVREQAEHRTAQESGGAFFDDANAAVAVFQRARKVARLKGSTHVLVLADRHFTAIDQSLGAAADATVQGTHPHLLSGRRGQSLSAKFNATRLDQPAGVGG